MKNEQNLDFGVHLAPLAADDPIVTTTGSISTHNTCLAAATNVRLVSEQIDKRVKTVSNFPYCRLFWKTYPSMLLTDPPSITVYREVAETKLDKNRAHCQSN